MNSYNRPYGRPYAAPSPRHRHNPPKRAGAEHAHRAPAFKPDFAYLMHVFSDFIKRMKRLTAPQAAVLGILVLVCVSVPAVLIASHKPPSEHAALSAGVKTTSAPPQATSTPAGTSAPQATSDPDETTSPPPDPTSTVIRQGMSSPEVLEIQKRLMALGYMDGDEPTDYFGPATSTAVSLFQRQQGLTVDGTVGADTYNQLMSDDAQNYTVMEGASGSDVKDLQTRLHELGYLDGVTGHFGDQTTKAVKLFQQSNGLTSDGKAGQKTFDLLFSSSVKPYFLKYGAQSDKVKTYQQRLKNLGYLMVQPDGNYGSNTVAAVKRFQEVNGLSDDGFLGSSTVSLLMSSKAHANALVLGMSGSDVQGVQQRLKALGYISHVTGYFGLETENGVKAFQKRNSLTADGTVGAQTLSTLNSGKAKKAASGSGSGSGGSGGGSGSGSGGSSSSGGVETLISIAQSKLGDKYVWGSKGPNTFDCSGFVYYCLNTAGVRQAYLTSADWASCGKYQRITSIGSLKRGDILVFSGSSAGHVGIYLGNGSMIDASSANGKVIKRTGMWDIDYWKRVFICAYRIF